MYTEVTTPASPKRREPVSKKRQRRATCCLSELTLLQDKYPEFFKPIKTAVDAILHQRDRTREADRAAVLQVLEDWDMTGIVFEDLVDEVEYLSRWEIGEILKEIEHLIEYIDEHRPYDPLGGVPRKILKLRSSVLAGWREADAVRRSQAEAA